MNKITAAVLAVIVALAVLAECERQGDLRHIEALQHIVPEQREAQWIPVDPGKVEPPLPVVPADYYEIDTVHTPFHADEMR